MALTTVIFTLSFLAGIFGYAFLFWSNRKPEHRRQLHHSLMLGGASLTTLGMLTFSWAMLASNAVPTRLDDPAWWWIVLCGVAGFLTFFLSGAVLSLSGAHKNLRAMPQSDRRSVVIPPALLATLLCAAPFLKVQEGSLVAQDGRILPAGSLYGFTPFVVPTKQGLNGQVGVTVSKPVESAYFGKKDLLFSAKILVLLKPGDSIPRDFHWFAFQSEVVKWFTERLGNRFVPEPLKAEWRLWGHNMGTIYLQSRSVGTTERGVVMGVPVSWDGTYSFRSR